MDILIIEDDEQVADLLEIMIRKWGYKTWVVSTGSQALNIVKTRGFDLVLLDIFLPDTIAYVLIPQLKRHWSGMQIITMTGQSSKDVEQKVRSQGILYYMVKPVDLAELKSLLTHLAGKLASETTCQ